MGRALRRGFVRFPRFAGAAALFLCIAIPAHAQFPSHVPSQGTLQGGPQRGTITVFIRGPEGGPISVIPTLSLRSPGRGSMPGFAQQNGSTGWVFSEVEIGDTYEVDVRADGYQPASQTVEMLSANTQVIVFMTPAGEQVLFHPPSGQFVLAPRAQKEVEKGIKDLNSGKISSAQKHFQKAMGMAPGSPYVNYAMGMSYLISKQLSQAKPYLEKSASIDPKQPVALRALGTLRFELADYSGAIEILNQSLKLDSNSWNAEWILADSYLRERDFTEARIHAEQALSVGKQKATSAQLLLGEALVGLGDRPKAVEALQTYIAAYPHDSNAAKIQGLIAELQTEPALVEAAAVETRGPSSSVAVPSSIGEPVAIPVAAPPVELPPKENWAPADIDAEKPFVISEAACQLSKLLDQTGKNVVRFVSDLQEFTATEEYQSVEVKRDERLETPDERNFRYMVFIQKPRPRLIEVKEIRDNDKGSGMPGRLVDNGAPALVLAFHPFFREDFAWRCEGLTEWKGQPAWLVHFEQRTDRPTSLLASFVTSSKEFALPLKGLAWISVKTDQVVRLETDLERPIEPLGLKREHWVIEYAPVNFSAHKVSMWLPESADVYIQFQGHYLHHQHRFSNFKLFWVGTSEKIGSPKETTSLRKPPR